MGAEDSLRRAVDGVFARLAAEGYEALTEAQRTLACVWAACGEIEKGGLAEPASRDHALHDEMVQAWQALEAAGPPGREAFRSLLTDDSPHVRGWVAAQLLALGDDSCVSILEAEAASGGLQGFESEMVLAEWKRGRLKPPLGTIDA